MTRDQAQKITGEVFSLYEQFGSAEYIGEPLSQIEHMVQSARLAQAEGCEDDVVLAAFLHDIGHLAEFVQPVKHMDGVGVMDHETIGADFLRNYGFSEKICRLVASHVAAKRYLTHKYPAYYEQLSEASRLTLAHQGGPMDNDEALLFENDPLHPLYIKLRGWDDTAKVVGQPMPDLEPYRQMMLRHLLEQ